jgi:hypothetical protein
MQGPGVGAENPESYGSFVGFYYLPKAGQSLCRKDRRRMLLREVLPQKFRAFVDEQGPGAADSMPKVANLLPIVAQLQSHSMSLRPRREEVLQYRTSIYYTPNAATPTRQSWLYQTFWRLFSEAVYVHSYTGFNPSGSLLLANIIWDEMAKNEALEQSCLRHFNTDALAPELQDFLFDPNAPFAKLRIQVNIQCYMMGRKQVETTKTDGKKEKIWVNDPLQCLRPHYAVANMPCAGAAGRGKLCPALVGGLFAMRLYGTSFTDNPPDIGKNIWYFPQERRLPKGFDLRVVSTHEGSNWDRDQKKSFPAGYWLASPNNCKIANTDNHNISQSFYSVVMGKCMQYCDVYRDDRPWDDDVTAIVTLHIVLEDASPRGSDADVVRNNCAGSLSETAQRCYDAWEAKHQHDAVKLKNPFEEFYNLLKADGSLARTRPRGH